MEKTDVATLRQHLQVNQSSKKQQHPAEEPTAAASVTVADTYRIDQLLAKEAG